MTTVKDWNFLVMWKKARQAANKTTSYITFQANLAQIEDLLALGAISSEIAAAGRHAGSLNVKVPADVYAAFLKNNPTVGERSVVRQDLSSHTGLSHNSGQVTAADREVLEQLAQRIQNSGLSNIAAFLLATNRPLSFVGSQAMVAAQPMAQMIFGANGAGWLGRYSGLLEKRANLDWLLARLENYSNTDEQR